jgi:hypothetical protein
MANLKISELPSAAPLSGVEILALVQGPATVKATLNELATEYLDPLYRAVPAFFGNSGTNLIWGTCP